MNEHDNDVFESASQELEKSIQEDEKAQPTDLGQQLIKSVTNAVQDFLAKGKGGQPSELSAEKDKRGSLTESGKDPAESPKKSGKGYDDSTKYEARKGEDMDDEDDEDDKPSFFKKKKKKKVKKMYKSYDEQDEDTSDEDESADEALDATEFVEELGDAVEHINKSVGRLEDGMAVFGELLAEMADPRRDKVLVSLAKAVSHLVQEQKEIKKSLVAHQTLVKAIAQMPGVPRVAGLQLVAQEAEAASVGGAEPKQISQADKDRLFRAAVQKQISTEEMNKAIRTGDLSVLEKVK